MDITEGKSTGIPTITAAMQKNGSPAVKYDFDDSYSWFMATVPIHPVFLKDVVNDTLNDTLNEIKLTDRQKDIICLIEKDDRITIDTIRSHFKVSRPTINRDILSLKKAGVLQRVKGKKVGYWLIIKKI